VTSVLVDAGPLVAIVSAHDAAHASCLKQAETIQRPMLTCWPVLTEAAWLLRSRPASIHAMFAAFRDGTLHIAPLNESDIPPIERILETYASLRPQLADAALVHLAEREGLRTIFTLDRRDFSVYRLSRNRPLHLIP